ncbi:cbb3-type cytochrome c oxidase subunit I [Palleronia marisminoris]|uniref:cbb3-type cytochrome c oxidase subunit I n=1 Tax=Palleronia marisminoris TaxID=315423 RepID=UPI001C319DB8|nr:cbb3-type cytochrome c oxidase subunit I [Palleronia marisminoris]
MAGTGDAFVVHGFLVLGFCALLFFPVLSKLDEPEPSPDIYDEYYDDPIKVGIILAMVWTLVRMLFGLWVAYPLAWPDPTFDAPWASFGRLRPAHTPGVIFGFGGTALIATSFHVMQHTGRARLAGQFRS